MRDFAASFEPDAGMMAVLFERMLADPTVEVLVAEFDRRLIGYCVVHVHDALFANGALAWVEELMVAPDARRSGVGACLIESAEAWAAGRGAAYVGLATRRAEAFYLSRGYEPSATFFRRQLPRA